MRKSVKSLTLILFQLIAVTAWADDPNGLEKRALYAITTEVGGKKLAWTLVVPQDRPKELIGTNADKDKVELRPYKPGEKAQLWQLYPESVNPGPSYKIFCKFGSNENEPNAPVTLHRVNGDFSGDSDTKFHEQNNLMRVGINQASTETFFLVTKQPNGQFVFQSFYGVKEKLSEKGNKNGWAEERAVEAVKGADGQVNFRQKKLSKSGGQLWTVTKDGYL
jgi:hypothetical protein